MIFVGTAGLLGYWLTENVDWSLAGWLAIGGAVGAYAGARTMVRIPERQLRLLFGIFLLGAAIRMFVT